MDTRRLAVTAVAVACLALGACGDDEGSNVSLPSNITRPERSTTAPTATDAPESTESTEDPDRTTAPPLTQPDTGGPTTETPTTQTPPTEAPTTEPPSTEPPTTEPPTTEAPTTTETPTTETPTTETPTTETPTTETPTTETPTTETPTTETPATDPEAVADDSTPWWPWLLAGLAIIGLIAYQASRRSRQAAAWKQQTAAAFDEATRLATHVAAVAPDGAAMVAVQDAGQLADLAATLSALAAGTTDQTKRQAIGSVRDQVQVLHSVVDGISMAAGATPAALDYLKEQAVALHGAAARARAEVFPLPPGPDTAPRPTSRTP